MLVSLLTAVHAIGVVVWIGGVAFVTMTVFPMLIRMEDSFDKVLFFQGIEHRFARSAKSSVAVVKSYTIKADLETTAESLIDPYHIAYVQQFDKILYGTNKGTSCRFQP